MKNWQQTHPSFVDFERSSLASELNCDYTTVSSSIEILLKLHGAQQNHYCNGRAGSSAGLRALCASGGSSHHLFNYGLLKIIPS